METTRAAQEDAVRDMCSTLKISTRGMTPLRRHANSVYLLPREGIVARVTRWDQREHAARAVTLTRWLAAQGLPVTEPVDAPQPTEYPPHAITLWTYYPQPEGPPPSAGHLGALLRHLHDLPEPPFALPPYRPLLSLQEAVGQSTTLRSGDRRWLETAIRDSLRDCNDLDSPLGEGLIHGDAYPGNTLWDGDRALLGDWDEAAVGRRETDLANTFQGVRFGRAQQELAAFVRAYGYDPATWPGLRTLTDMRDLHTLGSFVRRADQGDTVAREQLSYRLRTLREGERYAKWDTH